MNDKKKFILVDGQGLIYRSFYALPQLKTTGGKIINAIYGFTMMLIKLLEEEKPDYIMIALDMPAPTFRHKEYKEYKAHRKKMPKELISQIPLIKKVISNYNISICEKEGYEADDIIGTVAKHAEEKDYETIIVTGDRDAFQLISSNTKVMITIKGITDTKIIAEKDIINKYGVIPEKIIDILALKGDVSDNIPGVPGIGEKTAITLIKEHGSLDTILKKTDIISKKSLREKIKEYKEQILMSKKLATIDREMPLEYDFNSFKIKKPNYDALWSIFKELEFGKLLKKITPHITRKRNEIKYNLIDTKEKLKKLIDIFKSNKCFSYYLIKSSENDMPSSILGIAISFEGDRNYYIPLFPLSLIDINGKLPSEMVIDQLRIFFEDKNIIKISHNIKSDIIVLNKYKTKLKGNNFDIAIAAYLLNPSKENYDLKNIFWEYLKYLKNDNKEDNSRRIKNACENAQNILKLKFILKDKLKEKNILFLFKEIEMPLIKVLAEMEINGIKVDLDVLRKIANKVDLRLKELKKIIYNLSKSEFNINSPKQLSIILFEKLKLPIIKKTKTGYSTNAEVLKALLPQHKIISFILEYRELGKLKNTYIDKLPFLIDAKTKRIHTCFHQTITSTGRLSSSKPNLQNIPVRTEIGREIRKAFIAEKGFILLSADYSQIELRILAHLSQDKSLINAFANNEDVHTHTASEIFDIDQDVVSEKMRRMAKIINFGIIYGMSSYGLAQNLGISRAKAEEYIYNYFNRYQGVREYIEKEKEKARENGYILTLLKRRRYLEGIHSQDKNIREFNERIAINAPVQGSAADLIKVAMIKICEEFKKKKYKSKLLIQIHDELIFEIHQKELKQTKKIIKNIMENSLEISVPLKVNLKEGLNWAELN